ncbi:hypothetical protein F5888DRAFT_1631828 [Russula emetica]|nr:hypothetical protein F5888DRAFT_1631828 [Russula emetica]
MFHPMLFSLSNELIVKIISNLCPLDVYSCRCTCRKLNRLIIDSPIIQYTILTDLSGVSGPLDPDISLSDHLDAFNQWETAWREIDLRKPNASIDEPALAENDPDIEYSFGRYFVLSREGYGISGPGYAFLDLHARSSSSHTNATRWKTIKIKAYNLMLAFAPELNVAVAIEPPTMVSRPGRGTPVTIRPLLFTTGKRHPLASRQKFEVLVSGAAAHNLSNAVVIKDFVLYWVGTPMFNPTTNKDSICGIYLIAWKEGWASELRASEPGVYGPVLSVLSEGIVLLVRLREPALELCRLSNIGDCEKASLETVCILSLPELTPNATMSLATCDSQHPGHVPFSRNSQQHPPSHPHPHPTSSSGPGKNTGSSTRQPEGKVGSHRHLRFVPRNHIINVVMHVDGASGDSRMVDLIAPGGIAGARLAIPWNEWGPTNTRIQERDSLTCGSYVGERCATVLPTRITIRDYNPYRVGRALALLGGAGREVTLESGSVVKVVKEPSVYRGGEWFRDDIETSLPYVETAAPYKEDECEGVFMDEDNLVVEVHTEDDKRKFFLHSL